jgi:hypothetical protein
MAVEMIGLGGAVVSSASTLRKLLCIQLRKGSLMPCRPTLNSPAPFTAVGGYYREEAIMLLRRFYMSENSNGTYALLRDLKLTPLSSSSKEKDYKGSQDRYSSSANTVFARVQVH